MTVVDIPHVFWILNTISGEVCVYFLASFLCVFLDEMETSDALRLIWLLLGKENLRVLWKKLGLNYIYLFIILSIKGSVLVKDMQTPSHSTSSKFD